MTINFDEKLVLSLSRGELIGAIATVLALSIPSTGNETRDNERIDTITSNIIEAIEYAAELNEP